MTKFVKDHRAHPANGPLTEERLIRVRDELAAAAKRSDGGNLGYMMADAAKAIDELLALRKAGNEPVADVVAWHHPTEERTCDIRLRRHDIAPGPLYAAPQLPQPAVVPTFDEWCAATDNKPLGWVKDTMREAYDGCRAAMLQGAEPVQGWIPCSERMPEHDVDVQVYCHDKKEQMVGYLERNENEDWFRFATWRSGDGIYCQPTHWMPLPAAPQQEVK